MHKISKYSQNKPTYLLVRFLCNAVWPTEFKYIVQWITPNSLWWSVSYSFILQENWFKDTTLPQRMISLTKRSLYSIRRTISYHLPHYIRNRKNRNLLFIKAQWSIQISHSITKLSQSNNTEAISLRDGFSCITETQSIRRQIAACNVSFTQGANFDYLRTGFYSTRLVWHTRTCTQRIQSSKNGRVSYHPILCFNDITKDFWHRDLRAGDTYTSTRVTDLLEEVFSKSPASVNTVTIRADCGFYNHDIIEKIEDKAQVIIYAKTTQPLKRNLPSLQYTTNTSGAESAEFYYQPHGWRTRYRFIAIRRPLPKEQTPLLSLFPTIRYSYQAFATNMKLTPLNCWKFYNKCEAVELIIKELKHDYTLAKRPTKHFQANEAYFHILLFSYILLN
jgi:hypothetical protein